MKPYYEDTASGIVIYHGRAEDVMPTLPSESVHCCVTSPPYWGLRDYGVTGQLGLEPTPEEYVGKLVDVFREVRRVLRDDGTCWVNLGDSYASSGLMGDSSGLDDYARRVRGQLDNGPKNGVRKSGRAPTPEGMKPKDLIGIPWSVAFALRADGWYLRSDIIWHKPSPMPESVTDRPTKAHEYIFLLSKSERYWYDAEAICEAADSGGRPLGFTSVQSDAIGRKPTGNQKPENYYKPRRETRNRRSVWTVASVPYPGSHFAVFPPKLIEPCIKAGCPAGGTVLDPFHGSGTTGYVAQHLGCRYVGIELNAKYIDLSKRRVSQRVLFGAA